MLEAPIEMRGHGQNKSPSRGERGRQKIYSEDMAGGDCEKGLEICQRVYGEIDDQVQYPTLPEGQYCEIKPMMAQSLLDAT